MRHAPLRYKELNINTQQEYVAFMHSRCPVCISEGFRSLTRLKITYKNKSINASLNTIDSPIVDTSEIGLSTSAAAYLGIQPGDLLEITPLPHESTFGFVRKKLFGKRLTESELFNIMGDIVQLKFSNIQIAAFIAAFSSKTTHLSEIIGLTKAMINTGNTIQWPFPIIADKHCIGGIPGNRTTPIIIAILAAARIYIPKTSSRAITSPSGTADTMEVLTNVTHSLQDIRKIVQAHYGCLVWGGSAQLSPADDIIIRVERALDIDSECQLIASVLSKKKAVGSTHVLIDIPVGKTAKVRTKTNATQLKKKIEAVAKSIHLKVYVMITDGTQPIGFGIGPSLEAFDILSVLKNEESCPKDLKEKSLQLAGKLLELTHHTAAHQSYQEASRLLENGDAWKTFQQICIAQGGLKTPQIAPYFRDFISPKQGMISEIDNRKLARLAKLAGAPQDKSAGIRLFKKCGEFIATGAPLFRVYADSESALNYAWDYLTLNKEMIKID